ncbi:MAG: DEAD/DEAH box helicase, partial [bacterium]
MTEQTTPQDNPAKPGGRRRRRRGGRNRNRGNGATQQWDISQFQVEPQAGKLRFHDLELPDELMHGIADLGFQYCSPIQARSLPFTLRGHDVVGKAQTGTGKTAAFLLTIIDDLLKHPVEDQRFAGEARALVLAPTRELVMQIADDAKNLCKYTGLNVHT